MSTPGGAAPNDPPPSYEETMRLVAMGVKQSIYVPTATGYQVINNDSGYSQPGLNPLCPSQAVMSPTRPVAYTTPSPHSHSQPQVHNTVQSSTATTTTAAAQDEEAMRNSKKKVYCACFLLTLLFVIMICATLMVVL